MADSALEFINSHPQAEKIKEMYRYGPPASGGWQWASANHFPVELREVFRLMKKWVLDMSYESSAYGITQRAIEQKVITSFKKSWRGYGGVVF